MIDAQFQEADLTEASFLEGTNATNAVFDHAIMTSIQAGGVIFERASFIEADLSRAQLPGANLHRTTLSGCNLTDANLQGVDLRGAVMDDQTELQNTEMDQNTRFADVHWNDAPLQGINVKKWPQVLGDEGSIAPNLEQYPRVQAYRAAERAYRGLAQTLRAQGMVELASRYRRREKQVAGKALGANGQYIQRIGAWLLHTITGYGESISIILRSYLIAVFGFAIVYFFLLNGINAAQPGLTLVDALVFSVTSFHGRGFFPSFSASPSPHDPIVLFAMGEAVFGLFIEATLIASFSRRFLEN